MGIPWAKLDSYMFQGIKLIDLSGNGTWMIGISSMTYLWHASRSPNNSKDKCVVFRRLYKWHNIPDRFPCQDQNQTKLVCPNNRKMTQTIGLDYTILEVYISNKAWVANWPWIGSLLKEQNLSVFRASAYQQVTVYRNIKQSPWFITKTYLN